MHIVHMSPKHNFVVQPLYFIKLITITPSLMQFTTYTTYYLQTYTIQDHDLKTIEDNGFLCYDKHKY